ncbi:MAG TPA: hypothetical protein VGX76_20350 [Pirellulales bacterium]|jgi:hypothetical protein|nr:hypothetical protein [Pirellulales bacterium]
MAYSHDEAEGRAQNYAANQGLTLGQSLGFGVHGQVWATNRRSAVKAHAPDAPHYARERDIYLRLQERSVTEVRGFHVPQLLGFDDDLWVLEISIVRPPFVLDFAGAYLDQRPDFSDETWAEWESDKKEQFGAKWPQVRLVLAALERYGIYMSDVTPNNVRFAGEEIDGRS